jgi:hypothetical protein|tara:strand:+ start:3019 stop:3450 length:432 start_codon:yes stop_codon:yes gene_type:complete
MINLDEIQDMWRRDSKLDPDNLHLESLKIPGLHSKYYDLYNQLKLLRVKAEAEFAEVKLERHRYYTGKAPQEVYVAEPFPYKVRDKESLKQYLDADPKIQEKHLKIKYYEIMLSFLEEVIKTISNRTYQIKNAIEWQRFIAGQ